MRPPLRPGWKLTATVLIILTLGAGTAAATHTVQAPAPEPGLDDLGLDTNDVREEPSHPDDDNNFPGDHDGPYFSPAERTLILDANVAPGSLYSDRAHLDLDNVVNRVQHGDNYGDHERTMYPGVNRYSAWWGWWADTGGGGDLQTDATTSGLPGVGEANGAIDDAPDCNDREWDEFTFRGDHPCPDQVPRPAYPDDQMFAFIQPGTHKIHFNSLVNGLVYGAVLDSQADKPSQPDFQYREYHEHWEESVSPTDLTYDASLLITTTVTSAVNPKEVNEDTPGTEYDPHAPAEGLADPVRDHAVDVDVYTAPVPALEEAYRTTVWDPGNDVDSPTDALHPEGPKAWAKETIPAAVADAAGTANDAAASALAPTERQRGLADDLVQGPYFQEPNTPDDVYGFASDGTEATWATHDPSTSYGGLDGDYFEPGPDQAHTGYQDGERFWADLQVKLYYAPIPTSFGFGMQWTPEAPSLSDPVAGAAQEDDDNTQGPGLLFVDGVAGTWHDANGDGWVGDAGEDGHPYDNGTTDDPQDTSSDEFRGTCGVDFTTTLHPTTDTDGDGTNDWGAAGVYVVEPRTLTYGSPWMDAVGRAADPVLDPVRENVPSGDTVFPERERLEQYRRTGPIHLDTWVCPGSNSDSGDHQGWHYVLLPTGSLDFGFEAVTEATLVDELRVSQHGDNEGQPLAGQTIVDVDRVDAIVDEGP